MAKPHFLRRVFATSLKIVPVITVLFLVCACSEGVTSSPPGAPQSSAPTVDQESPPIVHGQAGTIWAWGMNDKAQLGVAQAGQLAKIPVNVQNLTDVTALVTFGNSAFALRKDGSVWGWGGTAYDALRGDSLNITQEPVQVPGFRNIRSLFHGTDDTQVWAVDESGNLWGWGKEDQSAWQVAGLSGVVEVTDSAIGVPSTALLEDGTVWENLCSTCTPKSIDGLRDIREIRPGIALASDGQVWAVRAQGPELVTNLSGVTHVWGSLWSTAYALKDDGTLWTWPSEPTDGRYVAEQVAISLKVTSVITTANGTRLIIVTGDGTVWNLNGADATEIQGLPSARAYATMSNGGDLTQFVLDDEGYLWAWGDNSIGVLLNGTTNSSDTPIKLPLSGIKSIVVGDLSVFAIQG